MKFQVVLEKLRRINWNTVFEKSLSELGVPNLLEKLPLNQIVSYIPPGLREIFYSLSIIEIFWGIVLTIVLYKAAKLLIRKLLNWAALAFIVVFILNFFAQFQF